MSKGMYRIIVASAVLLSLATPALAVDSDEQIIDLVRQAIIRHKLVDRPDCIDYTITRNYAPQIDQVALREHHDAKCGGDPETGPHLFNVLIDHKTHQLATDASDPADGGLEMLR